MVEGRGIRGGGGGWLIRSSKFQRIMYWVEFSLSLPAKYEDIHINTYSIFEAKGGTLT